MATAEHTLTAQTGATPAPAARSIGNETSRRMLRFVAIFRAVVAVVLLAIALGFRNPQLLGIRDAGLFLASAASYCLFALLLLVWQWRRPVIVPRLVLVELLIDVLAIILLMYTIGAFYLQQRWLPCDEIQGKNGQEKAEDKVCKFLFPGHVHFVCRIIFSPPSQNTV